MPLYDYACPECGRRFEVLHRGARSPVTCRCGTEAVRQPSRFSLGHPPTGAGLRSRFRLFQEATQELDHAETHVGGDPETSRPRRSLWKPALQRAQAMIASGEAPSPRPLD